jgi:hypothetical protein
LIGKILLLVVVAATGVDVFSSLSNSTTGFNSRSRPDCPQPKTLLEREPNHLYKKSITNSRELQNITIAFVKAPFHELTFDWGCGLV